VRVALALLLVSCGVPHEAIVAEPEPKPQADLEVLSRPRPATAVAEREVYRGPPPECELGETRSCFPPGTGPRLDGMGPWMRCVELPDGFRRFSRADCATPLVLSFDDAPVRFTNPPGAFAIGSAARTEWVGPETPWLALPARGCVESERDLFGVDERASNGFEKLARLDANGDGRIDGADPAYARLVLWYDRDQDRACTASELVPLRDAGVLSIELAYTSTKPLTTGSYEGERARFARPGGRGSVVDVYLAPR
jgi:hypothetical protein